ncbi:S8 family serine peptidase [Sporosarcina sp. JAI121]|uniref:S8 family peptidase n=1 Tax=Sporosarcina sp. JAI121 TaxID=2723064 RepID=UPI0015CC3FD2|nr:S8 family serine peptidase [Sporosarcina sp. JAI121]NYF23582.1 subtilisin family serine protease [Sporosarcina sp. JAI121]
MRKFLLASTVFLTGVFLASPVFAEETDRIIVQVVDDEGNQSVESVLLEEVEGLRVVEVLQPDFIRSIDIQENSVKTVSWGTERVGANRLKSITNPIEGSAIVAIIDTGVDYTHPLLKDRIVSGFDFINNDTTPMDVHFHGTHIAGIIAETTSANVKIMPIRAINEEGKGYDSDIANGIRFAVDNGADVINLSFSGEEYSPYLADAIEYALSRNVPVVVAAGNESIDTKNFYPASEDKVIVVSATDKRDSIASFSNTGASIDVSAPGVDIISSMPGHGFASMSGTSMATPFVSGLATMLKLEDPTRSVADIDRLLKKYVDDRGATGWDPLFGEGIVNVTSYDEGLFVNKEDTASTKYIPFPEQRNVPLDAKWTITFDRQLTDGDVVKIKLLRGDKEVKTTLTSNIKEQEIIVSPTGLLLPRTTYRLLLFVEHGKDYEMVFVTGS